MDPTRRFRLGVFAIVACSLFLGLLGFVLHGVLRSDLVGYFIMFEENVKGMVVGSRVNFQGVPLGMVKDIRFQNGKTLVEVHIDPDKAVIQDITRARLDRLLVTGQVTVELEGYGPTGKPLPPGRFIAPKADPLHSLAKSLPEVIGEVQVTFGRLDEALRRVTLLLGDDNQQRLSGLLANAERAAAALPHTLERADGVLARAESSLAAIEALAPDARQTLASVRAIEAAVGGAAREFESVLTALRAPLTTSLGTLRTLLEEGRGLARQLRLAPDSLLFGVTRPATPAGGSR